MLIEQDDEDLKKREDELIAKVNTAYAEAIKRAVVEFKYLEQRASWKPRLDALDKFQKANVESYIRVKCGRMEGVTGYARAGAKKAILFGLMVVMASVFAVSPVIATTYFGNQELFDQAISSLTTPELISQYQQKNFSYFRDLDFGSCGVTTKTPVGTVVIRADTKGCFPDYIFWKKRANCSAFSTFAVYALRKAGYEAYIAKIQDNNMLGIHYLVIFKGDNGKWSIMNNGAPIPQGIKGSYDSLDAAKARLAELGHEVLNLEVPEE